MSDDERHLRNLETYPDQRIGRPAPAVPVGVQPEPAEGVPCDCMPGFPHLVAPAVPVVHPEPGDRAATMEREDRWAKALAGLFPRPANYATMHRPARALMALADAEVAAAVAAVRTDTERSIIERRDRDGFIAVTNWSAGWHQGMTDAAALIQGRS